MRRRGVVAVFMVPRCADEVCIRPAAVCIRPRTVCGRYAWYARVVDGRRGTANNAEHERGGVRPAHSRGGDAQPEGACSALGAGASRGPPGHDGRARRGPLGRRAARDVAQAAPGVHRPAADRDRAQRHRDHRRARTPCASTPTPWTWSASSDSRQPPGAHLDDDPARALDAVERALELWRGTPYADLASWTPAVVEAGRLDEVRMELEEARVDATPQARRGCGIRRRGRAAGARGAASGATVDAARHGTVPGGRQADALAAIRAARERLADELGAEPGAELAELELGILRHDDAARPRRRARESQRRLPLSRTAAVRRGGRGRLLRS